MSKLMVYTQIYENYGHRWKPKGGNEFFVSNVSSAVEVDAILETVKDMVEYSSDSYREYFLDWEIVDDNYFTQYQMDQLEYEGAIRYSPKELMIQSKQ